MEKILAFLDPERLDGEAFGTALRLARDSGATLHLHRVVHVPLLNRDIFHLTEEQVLEQQHVLETAKREIEELVARAGGPDCVVEVSWGHPFDKAALDVIEAARPDLVILGLRRAQRPSVKEWHILRGCVPDLLVAQSGLPVTPQIMACVDPTHAHDKPADLDRRILRSAQRIARAVNGKLVAMHAMGMIPFNSNAEKTASAQRAEREEKRRAEIDAIKPEGADLETWIAYAESPEALKAYASERRQNICVIGALARSRLREWLLGGALQYLLPRLKCNFLLVHPDNIRDAVAPVDD